MQDRLFAKIVDEVANSKGQLVWSSSGVTVVNQIPPPDPTAALPATAPPGAFHAGESR
jgi:hypothetical protein